MTPLMYNLTFTFVVCFSYMDGNVQHHFGLLRPVALIIAILTVVIAMTVIIGMIPPAVTSRTIGLAMINRTKLNRTNQDCTKLNRANINRTKLNRTIVVAQLSIPVRSLRSILRTINGNYNGGFADW